jgi:hypothetical protein
MDTRGRDFATRCWKEDEEFLGKEKIAEWLGSECVCLSFPFGFRSRVCSKPINKAALRHYINFFDFTGLRLDLAFRCVESYVRSWRLTPC